MDIGKAIAKAAFTKLQQGKDTLAGVKLVEPGSGLFFHLKGSEVVALGKGHGKDVSEAWKDLCNRRGIEAPEGGSVRAFFTKD